MVDSYGELVRQARDAKNISAKQLSEKLNVSAPFITDIEKNRRLPSLQNQNKIKNCSQVSSSRKHFLMTLQRQAMTTHALLLRISQRISVKNQLYVS